jgi:hypothetical protein
VAALNTLVYNYPFIGFSPASSRASLMCIKTAFSIGMQVNLKSFFASLPLTSHGSPNLPSLSIIGLFPKVILASGMYFFITSAKSRRLFGGPPTL